MKHPSVFLSFHKFIQAVVPYLFLFFLALWYRFSQLDAPFWVDEFSSAAQAKLFLEHGLQVFQSAHQYVEYHNILPHFLISLSFKWIGYSEFSARLPFMVGGALVPVSIYLLLQKTINRYTAFLAGLLSATSYFLITWSRQARGYMLQELFAFLAFFFYFQVSTKPKASLWMKLGLLICLTFGILTHTMFALVIIAILTHYLFFHHQQLSITLRQPWVWIGIVFTFVVAGVTGQFTTVLNFLSLFWKTGIHNNVWYYHAFLWREYALVTFLGTVGLAIGFFTHRRVTSLFLLHAFAQMFFVCFIMGPYVSRYILFVFTYLLIGMAYALTYFTHLLKKQHADFLIPRAVLSVIPLIIILVIIKSGDKFTFKPAAFYSVNHDFREIALIDYDQVYTLIRQKGKLEEGKTAVIDTWPDRIEWYLGKKYAAVYTFRWADGAGLMKQTPYTLNQAGEKVILQREDMRLITEVSDLQKVLAQYPKGFIWIDDSTLPQDVQDYVAQHFKLELELDHYPLDDNPYSRWPGRLYSWGI